MTAGQAAMFVILAALIVGLGVAANREWKRANRAEAEADDHAARLVIAQAAWERAEREAVDAENAAWEAEEEAERVRRQLHHERARHVERWAAAIERQATSEADDSERGYAQVFQLGSPS